MVSPLLYLCYHSPHATLHTHSHMPHTRASSQVDDVVKAFDLVSASYPAGTPIFVLGQSLGGLIVSYLCLARPDKVAGLLLCSSALDIEWTPMLR